MHACCLNVAFVVPSAIESPIYLLASSHERGIAILCPVQHIITVLVVSPSDQP